MGLLSRIGTAAGSGLREMGSNMEAGAAYGGLGGALLGTAGNGEMGGNLNPGTGLVAGLAGGAALGGANGLRKLVMGIAQALKQQHPQVPDEMILKKAMEMAQQQAGQQGGGMMPPMGGGGGMPPGGPMGGM